MSDDDPITLEEAIKLFPRARLTKSTLRAERDRGHLDIFRLGRRDHTTPKSMREMVRKCQESARRRVFTSTESATNGSSATERFLSAQAAANETVRQLKNGSRNTSAISISPNLRGRR